MEENYEEDAESSDFTDSEKLFFESIKNSNGLSKEKEIELGKRIASGDEHAKEELCNANYKLVAKIAKEYYIPSGMTYMDLVMEGCIGLMKAAEKFDVSRGCRFSTAAVPWIRKAIRDEIVKHGRVLRLPEAMLHDISKANKAHAALEQNLDNAPTDEDIAADTGLSLNRLKELNIYRNEPISFSAPSNGDAEDGCIEDYIASEGMSLDELAINNELHDDLETVIDMLPPCEADVIRLRFGLNEEHMEYTLAEVAKECGITLRRAQTLLDDALNKLGNCPTPKKLLESYLYDEDDFANVA